MIRKIGLILIFLSSLYLLTVYLGKRNIINEEAEKVQEFMEAEKKDDEFVEEEDYFMILEIPKIKLKRGLYGLNSYLNNVNSNLEILSSSNMPDTQNSNLIIAGHSGNSDVSYFKNLYKLENNDYCYIYYKGYKYIYQIVNIYNQKKTGTISIYKDNDIKTITLITCTLNNDSMQTVYIGNLVKIETY